MLASCLTELHLLRCNDRFHWCNYRWKNLKLTLIKKIFSILNTWAIKMLQITPKHLSWCCNASATCCATRQCSTGDVYPGPDTDYFYVPFGNFLRIRFKALKDLFVIFMYSRDTIFYLVSSPGTRSALAH